ncbi:MAG: putative ABC transporter permease [bacterium]|nr:putative ABC transporter permease [bacterium]
MVKEFKSLIFKDYKFDFSYLLCTYVFLFLIGSIVGFIYEEFFYYFTEGIIEKRGFLYGLYLPVYGFGAVFMVLFLKRFKKYPILIFLLSMLVTGILEYITGYAMFSLYHRTWWDYTGLFLNIDGYVCFRSVFTFAIGGLLLIYIIEPLVCKFVNERKLSSLITCSFLIIFMFVFDFIFTILFRNTL